MCLMTSDDEPDEHLWRCDGHGALDILDSKTGPQRLPSNAIFSAEVTANTAIGAVTQLEQHLRPFTARQASVGDGLQHRRDRLDGEQRQLVDGERLL